MAFKLKDDAKELLKYFLIFGTIASLSGIIHYIIYVLPLSGRLGFFVHPLTSGGMTMIISILLVSVLANKQSPKRWKIGSAIGLVSSLTALLATSSRSSWLGFILGVIIVSIFIRKEVIYFLIIGLFGFFILAPQSVHERIESIWNPNHHNNIGRLNMWETGIEIWKDYPVFGVGDRDLKEIYVQYKQVGDNEPGGHLHNTIIMWLVTTGIVGFLAVMFLIFRIILGLWKTYQSGTDWFTQVLSIGVFASFFGFLLNGMFEWNFGDSEIVTYVSILLGLCWIVLNSNLEAKNRNV